MMRIRSPVKVPAWVWSFLIKAGILTLGVLWVILIKLPPSQNQHISDDAPVPTPRAPGRLVKSSEPPGPEHLSDGFPTLGLKSADSFSRTDNPEGVVVIAGDAALLDVNTATQEELERLPGLGTALAQRILAYRQANGPFRQVEELQKVRGIGRKRLQQLRPLIRIATKKA